MKQRKVEVVVHDAESVQVNGETPYEEIQPLDERLFAMAKVFARVRIDSAQKRVPHTPGGEVVEQWRLGIDLKFSWCEHACSVRYRPNCTSGDRAYGLCDFVPERFPGRERAECPRRVRCRQRSQPVTSSNGHANPSAKATNLPVRPNASPE